MNKKIVVGRIIYPTLKTSIVSTEQLIIVSLKHKYTATDDFPNLKRYSQSLKEQHKSIY